MTYDLISDTTGQRELARSAPKSLAGGSEMTPHEAWAAHIKARHLRVKEKNASGDARRYRAGTATFARHMERADKYGEQAEALELKLAVFLRELARSVPRSMIGQK